MNVYISDIVSACVFFPVLALLLTVPYMIYQYRKLGSIPWLYTLIVYSFVFYLLCVYCLVLLPLPENRSIYVPGAEHPNLVPFNSFHGIRVIFDAGLSPWGTFKALLKNPSVYQYLFNILMLVPLGMYLRYFFKCGLVKTVLISFLFSLSFETLQYTGIFGLYEHPYRFADVDDLIANTLGGLVGYLMMGPVTRILPRLSEVDQQARQAGVRVSVTRRALSFFLDMVFIQVVAVALSIALANLPGVSPSAGEEASLWELVTTLIGPLLLLVAFALVPALTHGQTLGQKVLKIYVARVSGARAPWYLCAARYFLMFLFAALPFLVAKSVINSAYNAETANALTAFLLNHKAECVALFMLFLGVWALSLCVRAFVAWRRQAPFVMLNGLITGTRVLSIRALEMTMAPTMELRPVNVSPGNGGEGVWMLSESVAKTEQMPRVGKHAAPCGSADDSGLDVIASSGEHLGRR